MRTNDLPCAEDINYWKTGKSSPDIWIDRAKRQIENLGGKVLMEGFGSDSITGRAAFLLTFEIGGDRFKVTWPVLFSRTGNERAARIQAATMLYRDIKAKCMSAAVLGAQAAFFSFLALPDGRVAAELAVPELLENMPRLLEGGRE